jgi:formate hydrogenlyase transcriptional activator
MGMLEANVLAGTPLNEGLVSRYEALIRLAEAIRSHPDEKDLFRTCANELHQVIPFDGLSHFDLTVKFVQWNFLGPYEDKSEAAREELASLLQTTPKEQTITSWICRNQQPLLSSWMIGRLAFVRLLMFSGNLVSARSVHCR